MTEYLKLENQVCFPIYALARQMAALYRPYLDKLGLTYPQYLVMLVLWEHKSATVKCIGELLWLDSGTLTPLLKRMESNGLLSRKRSCIDERVVDIVISEKGEGLRLQAENIPMYLKEQLETEDEQLIALREQLKRILLTTSKCKL
ncbi:DNA-binding MarR family transcriptional regulator [Dysgonomonas alginatilytica]|uniref:DNA-binding MarR family transcriptional regulator n=1 Tax=Dysgonomonas alginatilytica TaxID=1605892 RepID=A0A2V3PRP9_9BACT|nr:MarR family transcriptional regulator [Dysgonomonas alginatilytica]PXV65053.1 DNA-binding MarR family transcriptional regulator [Dysgonomonas alginatilytica]